MRKLGIRDIIYIFVGIIMIALVVTLIIDGSNTSYVSFIATYTIFSVVILSNNKKTHKFYYLKNVKKGKNMEKQILERLIDKKVIIHTIDEYIEGVVVEVTDSTIIINKFKSNGMLKQTYYVQNNAIMSILEKNK